VRNEESENGESENEEIEYSGDSENSKTVKTRE
jgi:hypothetical protein